MKITALLTGKQNSTFKNKNKIKLHGEYIFNYPAKQAKKVSKASKAGGGRPHTAGGRRMRLWRVRLPRPHSTKKERGGLGPAHDAHVYVRLNVHTLLYMIIYMYVYIHINRQMYIWLLSF